MATLNSVPGAGVLVDGKHTIVDLNNRCTVVFAEGPEELCNESLRALQRRGVLEESTREQWESAVSAAIERGAVTDGQITLRPGGTGEWMHYDLRVTPLESDPQLACCSLRSVGTSRRYEETITALHISTRELMSAESVDEVLQRTADAASDVLGFPGTAVRRHETDVQFAEILAENAAVALQLVETAARLREERERLDRFASVVSHDLRNPLGIATLALERARETHEQEDFDRVASGLQRMERMVDDLLTLARSGAAVEDRETAELGELVEAAWETVQSGDASLTLDSDGDITCEPSLVQSLLENLVRNAVEHNDSPLTVRVGVLDDGGFYVADDGQGIPETNRETVLEHGVSGKGTPGLGLSIVRDIVDAHGWELTVTEGRNGGARFEIRTGS